MASSRWTKGDRKVVAFWIFALPVTVLAFGGLSVALLVVSGQLPEAAAAAHGEVALARSAGALAVGGEALAL